MYLGKLSKLDFEKYIDAVKCNSKFVITGAGYLKHSIIKNYGYETDKLFDLFIEVGGFSIDELYTKNISYESFEELKFYLIKNNIKKDINIKFKERLDELKPKLREDVLEIMANKEIKERSTSTYIASFVGLALLCGMIYNVFKK